MDVDETFFTAQIKAKLVVGTTGATIYTGYVPESVPTDTAGYIRPYIVLFGGYATDLATQRSYGGLVDMDVADWPFQTTIAGASIEHVTTLASAVKRTLTNYPIRTGWVRPDDNAIGQPYPLRDDQVNPARFYLPIPWRLTTT